MQNRSDFVPPLVVPASLGAGSFSMPALIESVVDPFLTVAVLFGAAHGFGIVPDGHYVILALLAFSLTFPGDIHLYERPGRMVVKTLLHWVLAAAVLLTLGYVTGYVDYFARPVLATWLVATPAVLVAAHAAARVFLPRIMALEGNQRRAVIVGVTDTAKKLAPCLRDNAFLGVHLAGSFDDRAPERLGEIAAGEHLGRLRDVGDYVRKHAVDHVYIALPMTQQPRILALLDDLKDSTASIFFVPDFFVTDLIQGRVEDLAGMPVVAVCETPFTGVGGLVKRTSDIVLALIILSLIAPLLLAIAIGVKLSSPGPVIFRQNRYGLDGRRIVVYKFRSMTVCEDGPVVVQARQGDARVTRFGAFLRRTSLDELPQFFNVLQGRMSVVGPRPHAVAHNETYRRLIKGYMVRHKVRPGITGWAQVNGCRGETDTVEKMVRRIEYDLDYLRRWSLALDLAILLRTLRLVWKDSQAY